MGTAGSNYTQLHSFTAVAGQNYIIEVKHPLTFTEIDEDGAGGDPQQVPGYLVDPSILQIPDDQDTRMPGERDQGVGKQLPAGLRVVH